MLPYNSSVSYLKEIYDGLLKSKGIACGSKFLGSTGNNFSEEDQPASYLLSKVVAGAQKEILSSRPNNRSQDDSQSLPALPGLGVATPIAEKTVSGSLSPFFRDGYL